MIENSFISEDWELSDENAPNSFTQRRLRDLRRRVIACREKWIEVVKVRSFEVRTHKKKRERSPSKTVYFVDQNVDCAWVSKMAAEFDTLKNAIRNAGHVGPSKPRDLWTPTVLFNPIVLERVMYAARSLAPVDRNQARAFAGRALTKVALPPEQLYLTSRTGYKYTLLAIYADGSRSRLPFPEWSVCLVEGRRKEVVDLVTCMYVTKESAVINPTRREGFMAKYKVLFETDGRFLLVRYDVEQDPEHYWDLNK